MSQYVALYRKYRPRTFGELVGQEHVARTLGNAITQGRLAHAYLFCGPRGTGKTSIARILAKAINCETGPTDTPCNACSNCREITNGTSLDVIEIDAASNNGVDNIRDLQDRVALAPVAGRYKVYIIDEVHMLSQGAFNALLKTLEEPPPNVVFVLATTDPHKVLATIVSRCQRFDFARIPLAGLVARLTQVAEAEGIQLDAVGIEAIARRANGGLRDALSLLDQVSATAGGQAIAAADVAASLGLLSGDTVCALGAALLGGDSAEALRLTSDVLASGYDHATVLRELMQHFRHLMVLQLAPDRAEALDVPTAQMEALRAQSRQATGAELPWILEVLNETEATVRRSPQQAIWLELGLIKVATRPAIPSFQDLVSRVERLEAALGQGVPAQALPRVEPLPKLAAPRPTAPEPVPPMVAEKAPRPTPPVSMPEPSPAPIVSTPPDVPPASTTAVEPPKPVTPPSPPSPATAENGQRVLPANAWMRVHEHVKAHSVPTAALLEQQAAIEGWEPDGAVVVRIAKAYKEMFDKQAAKKKLLGEAIAAVFGPNAYPRLEVGDPKAIKAPPAAKSAPVSKPAAPPPAPLPPPAPSAPQPSTMDDIPPAEPPDWFDEIQDAGPVATTPTVAAAMASATDPAVGLVVDLFNGRMTNPPQG